MTLHISQNLKIICHRCPYKRQCEGYHKRYQLGIFPEDAEIIKGLVEDLKGRL